MTIESSNQVAKDFRRKVISVLGAEVARRSDGVKIKCLLHVRDCVRCFSCITSLRSQVEKLRLGAVHEPAQGHTG